MSLHGQWSISLHLYLTLALIPIPLVQSRARFLNDKGHIEKLEVEQNQNSCFGYERKELSQDVSRALFSEIWMTKQNTNVKKKIPNTKCLLAQGPWEAHLRASAKISLFWSCCLIVTCIYCGFTKHRMKDQAVSKQHKGPTVTFFTSEKFLMVKSCFL